MPTIKSYQNQKEKEQIAVNYFLSQGYSPEAVSGIVGNLVYESGLNTKAEGDIGYKGGSSYGIAQFRGQRLKNLKNQYGDKWTDFRNQLEFVNQELNTTHKKAGNALKNTRDSYTAGQVFSDFYEIPAKKYKDNTARQKQVSRIYSSLGNSSQTPISDAAISNVNDYFNSLSVPIQTNEVILDSPEETIITEEETIPEKEDDDIKEAKQKTAEYNFLKDYQEILNSPATQTVVQEPLQETTQPMVNLQDIFTNVSNFVDTPLAQQGGTVKDNIPNLQYIKLKDKNISPQAYLESYLQSPVYLERLRAQGYPQPEKAAQYRLDRLQDVDVYYQDPNDSYLREIYRSARGFEDRNNLGSAYSPSTNKVTINNKADQENIKNDKVFPNSRLSQKSIEAHELSHSLMSGVPLNSRDEEELFSRLKDFQVDEDFRQQDKNDMIKNKTYNKLGHDFLPSENKADIDALRYLLYDKGIYDTRTDGEFNKWHLNQLNNNEFIKKRLKSNYSDEDLVWLMNNIADNSQADNNVYGQQGGEIESSKQFLQNWYKNRALPDPELNRSYQSEKQKFINESQSIPDPTYVDIIEGGNIQGEYIPDTNQIQLLNTASPYVYPHEATHKIFTPLTDTQTGFNAFRYIGENITPQENIENQWVKENYNQLSNYQEVVPRLNVYRQLHGLKPDQEITPELIRQNREQYQNSQIPFEDNTDQLYKLFNDEGLSNVLNKVVYNNNQNYNTYAQAGGEIITDNNGQWSNPGSITRITSPYITMKGVTYPVLGISEQTGEQKLMLPNQNYFFENTKSVIEYPQLTKSEKAFLKEISNQNE